MAPLEHTLWIGGPPGSGKTTVARRLARRHGLRLYSSDTRTWPHRDRALAAGSAAAARWERLRPADDWTDVTDADQLAMSLHAERGPMVLDDLAALPPEPLVVAEGSVLSAAAVAHLGDGRDAATEGRGAAARGRGAAARGCGASAQRRGVAAGAVWLLPAPGVQAQRLGVRGEPAGRMRLQEVLRAEIEREAATHRLPVLVVTADMDVDAVTAAVEQRFADAIGAGPRAADAAARRALLREANAALAAQAHDYFARPWAHGTAHDREMPFLCECGDTTCDVDLLLPADALPPDGPLLAAGHAPA